MAMAMAMAMAMTGHDDEGPLPLRSLTILLRHLFPKLTSAHYEHGSGTKERRSLVCVPHGPLSRTETNVQGPFDPGTRRISKRTHGPTNPVKIE